MSDTSRTSLVRIIYVLHLVGLITGGITAIAGVILAHLNAGDAPPPLREHFRFQYRTFWIGCSIPLSPASPLWPSLAGW